MDTVTQEKRSKIMSLVRAKNTKPEMLVRHIVHGLGYRYRLHVRTLPGSPDLVFPKYRKIIFVNGCFWHSHDNCKYATIPKTRVDFWSEKLCRNRARDKRNIEVLNELGWNVMTIWQCETRAMDSVLDRIVSFLGK